MVDDRVVAKRGSLSGLRHHRHTESVPGLVLGDLFQIFQPELQPIVGQLLGRATNAMAEQALDQHLEFIVFGVLFPVLLLRRRGHDISHHLLQEFRIIRQSFDDRSAQQNDD